LRLAAVFEGRLPTGSTGALDGTFADGNEPQRIGWREIVVVARGGARLHAATAPTTDSSDELRHYPADLTRAPLDLREATFRFTPGTTAVPAAPLRAAAAPTRSGGGFTSLVDRDNLTPFVLAGMLLLAALFGAVHALAPGHGKTVMAAYLVGTSGRPRDAVLLGTIVSGMHTASVLVLGVVLFRISRDGSVDRVFPWLELASGVLVAGLGGWMLRHRMGTLARAGHHDHDHDHHHHHHEHHHGPGGHTHALPGEVAPLSRRGLVVLATAGGLFPSPSALLVLVSAFTLGRPALGLALVGAFSLGLALTLTTVGLLLVLGKDAVTRRPSFRRALPALPVLGAAAITVVGSILAWRGISGVR
jgi:ABC-type nickel/cobalt efflux system permease component RcnA